MVSVTGVALASDQLCAVLDSGRGSTATVWRAPLESPVPGDIAWPSLDAAFLALADRARSTEHGVSLALMPDLAEVQMVELPDVTDDELRLLLSRSAGRYFTRARGAQVVGIGTRSAGTAARLVTAAPAALLTSIHAAADNAGIRITQIVPAEAAWATLIGASGDTSRVVVTRNPKSTEVKSDAFAVCDASACSLLTVQHGQLIALRRFRSPSEDTTRLAEAVRETAAATLHFAGPAGERQALAASSPVAMAPAAGMLATFGAEPDALAAGGAGTARSLQLVPESVLMARRTQSRTQALRLAAAAVVCVCMGLALQLWDVRRELAAVRVEREAIAPQLGSTLVGRTTVETAFRQLAVLARAEEAAPQWSTVIAALSAQLPQEAYLTGFRGRADTVGVEGLALSAARVFEAVERVPLLTDVQATSPVRRETTAEGDALERFQLSATLRGAVEQRP
jgi:hypothetical protein